MKVYFFDLNIENKQKGLEKQFLLEGFCHCFILLEFVLFG